MPNVNMPSSDSQYRLRQQVRPQGDVRSPDDLRRSESQQNVSPEKSPYPLRRSAEVEKLYLPNSSQPPSQYGSQYSLQQPNPYHNSQQHAGPKQGRQPEQPQYQQAIYADQQQQQNTMPKAIYASQPQVFHAASNQPSHPNMERQESEAPPPYYSRGHSRTSSFTSQPDYNQGAPQVPPKIPGYQLAPQVCTYIT